ncbi:MAG: hypothetical protein ACE141_01485 [Bryobacteraceae bacterium]
MPSNKVVCPHCGHDGTVETSRPPLGSYGFNYLAEGVVCREVRGFDESGRLRLSGDFKCEGSQATNARFECRSCWRTFAVPEGLLWAVVPEQSAGGAGGPGAAQAQAVEAEGIEAAAGAISRNLVSVLRSMVHEVEQAGRVQMTRLETQIAEAAGLAAAVPALQADLARLHEQAASEALAEEQWRSRIAAVEASLSEERAKRQETADFAGLLATQQEETHKRVDGLHDAVQADREAAGQLRALCEQLQEECRALRQRLDAQAEVIRALHGAALEQTARREELRAAVQRLEELTGATAQVKPLPEQL